MTFGEQTVADTTTDKRAILRHLFDTAVAAAHPAGLLAAHLPPPPKGRIILLGAGKAAGSMIAAAEAHYLDALGLPQPVRRLLNQLKEDAP